MTDVVVQAAQLLLVSLAAYRVWRLVGYDDITAQAREALDQRAQHSIPAAYAYESVTCPWCAGSLLAFAGVAVLDVYTSVWLPVAQALAAAVLVGWTHTLIESRDAG